MVGVAFMVFITFMGDTAIIQFAFVCFKNGILSISLAERSYLTSLQPIRIRAANAYSARAFPVWPAKWRVRAVCHLAARIDNNSLYCCFGNLLFI